LNGALIPAELIDDPNQTSRKPRWRITATFATIVCLVIFHPWLLQTAYGMLVIDESIANCRLAMVVDPTPECFDAVARMVTEETVDQILIVDRKPRRTVQIEVMPSVERIWTNDLISRGVLPSQIRSIATGSVTSHQMFRELEEELGTELEQKCVVICTSTLSHYYRCVIDSALPTSRACCFRVRAVIPMQGEESCWWRSRSGVRRVMNHGLRLAFVSFKGESDIHFVDPYRPLIDSTEAESSASG